MADVYLAEQLSLQRQVAFKVLKAVLAQDENYVRRFLHEARSAAALVHANIVQIHEVGQIEGVHFIAQEYVQGKNLREMIDRTGPLDVRLVVLVTRQVASALLRAAQHGLVHRDIKPENVLITASGEAKVADFGLAHVLREGEQLNLTQVGITMGTPLYMSPEQAQGKPLDHRSDLYSLGVTVYHMLTGQPPFHGDTALALAVQHLKTEPEPLSKRRPELPESLCRIVHRLLEKDPANRYDSARDLLRDLRMVSAEHGLDSADGDELWQALGTELAGPIEATRQLDEVMKTAALYRRRPVRAGLWLAAGVLGALAIGAACALAFRPTPLHLEALPVNREIPRQASAEAQYIYAGLFPNSKAHWQEVIDFKPHDEYFDLLARKELAWLYLTQDNDRVAASEIFHEFAGLPEFENELRSFGIAGLSVIASLEGRHIDALAGADVVWPMLEFLDPRMRDALEHAVQVSEPASNGGFRSTPNGDTKENRPSDAKKGDRKNMDRSKTGDREKPTSRGKSGAQE